MLSPQDGHLMSQGNKLRSRRSQDHHSGARQPRSPPHPLPFLRLVPYLNETLQFPPSAFFGFSLCRE